MGQKVHPKSIRLGVIHGWDSTWFATGANYAKNVKEDYEIRRFLKKRLKQALVSRIEIDRKASKLIIRIITGRPGIIVGRGGQGLDQLRKDLVKLTDRRDIQLDVIEVARIDVEAQLVAEGIAQQLEKRVAFRRTMKQAIMRTMRSGGKGIKVMVSGRLGGAEIARTEWAKEGRIPLHTFRADVDYGFAQAETVFGIIGVKVWIFKGEVRPGDIRELNIKTRRGGGEQGGPGDAKGIRGGGRGPGGPGGGGGRRGKRGRSGPVQTKQAPPAGEAQQPQPQAQEKPAEAPPAQQDKPSEEK